VDLDDGGPSALGPSRLVRPVDVEPQSFAAGLAVLDVALDDDLAP